MTNKARIAMKRAMADNDADDLDIGRLVYESSSDDSHIGRHGGSKPGRRKTVERNHPEGAARIKADYFGENPVFNSKMFRRRFRMSRPLFCRILNALEARFKYFQQHPDATGTKGLTGLQKAIAAIRILAYGVAADATDEYVRIGESLGDNQVLLQLGESTASEALLQFCSGVIELFGDEYLRSPNKEDMARLFKCNDRRGFPGIVIFIIT